MKILLPFFFASLTALAGICQRPTSLFQNFLDVAADGRVDFEHSRGALAADPNGRVVDYYYYLSESDRGEARLLRHSSVSVAFVAAEPIFSGSPLQGSVTDVSTIGLSNYLSEEVAPGVFSCRYRAGFENFNSLSDALVGLRLNLDDGPHYGWIRFTRPDTEPSTPFTVAGYNYHPLPNEPIGAGLPPTPPPVTTTYDEAAGTLSLNWDARFPGLVLEATESLTEPVEWKPVPDASGPPAVLPVPEGDRFYRLRTQ
jgi:hypothetical protein